MTRFNRRGESLSIPPSILVGVIIAVLIFFFLFQAGCSRLTNFNWGSAESVDQFMQRIDDASFGIDLEAPITLNLGGTAVVFEKNKGVSQQRNDVGLTWACPDANCWFNLRYIRPDSCPLMKRAYALVISSREKMLLTGMTNTTNGVMVMSLRVV